jgi:hypothetical protein
LGEAVPELLAADAVFEEILMGIRKEELFPDGFTEVLLDA